MKLYIKTILLCLTLLLNYQEKLFSQDSLFYQVDTFPDFKFNSDSIRTITNLKNKIIRFYQENSELKILKSYYETSAYKGLIILRFVVEKDGSLANIQIDIKGLETNENELYKILKKTGIWMPGLINGQQVRTALIFNLWVDLE